MTLWISNFIAQNQSNLAALLGEPPGLSICLSCKSWAFIQSSLERLCWCLYSLFKKWSVLCKLCILWLTGRGEQVIHRLIPVLCAQFKSFVRLLISRRYAASSMAVRWHSPAYPQDHVRQKWISHWAYSARVAENTLVLVYNSVFSDLSQLTRLMCISLWLKNKQHSEAPYSRVARQGWTGYPQPHPMTLCTV